MEVGSARERILIALLIYKFGVENVRTDIPITTAEVDAFVLGNPISIKTMTESAIKCNFNKLSLRRSGATDPGTSPPGQVSNPIFGEEIATTGTPRRSRNDHHKLRYL